MALSLLHIDFSLIAVIIIILLLSYRHFSTEDYSAVTVVQSLISIRVLIGAQRGMFSALSKFVYNNGVCLSSVVPQHQGCNSTPKEKHELVIGGIFCQEKNCK